MIIPKIPIAKEGYPFIGLAAFSTLIFAILDLYLTANLTLVMTAFILWFFRDPERFIPAQEGVILAPADGKVIFIEKAIDNPFTGEKAHKIAIFMNIFNVHVNRIPYSGRVEKIIHKAGKFYTADSKQASLENEHCATLISTSQGKVLVMVQIAGLIARRIVCWLEPQDEVTRGNRFGLIRFGSRVDLYLPIDTNITIVMGEKVQAGETILGYLQ